MLLNHSGSYYEEYRRGRSGSRARNVDKKLPKTTNSAFMESERLLTDRSAYISFLEVQLERVAAACLTSQSFSDRIDQVQATVFGIEERLNNLMRNQQQAATKFDTHVQDQEEKLSKVGAAASQVCTLVQNIQGQLDKLEGKLTAAETQIDVKVNATRAEFSRNMLTQQSESKKIQEEVQNLSESLQDIRRHVYGKTDRDLETINKRVASLSAEQTAHTALHEQLRSLVLTSLGHSQRLQPSAGDFSSNPVADMLETEAPPATNSGEPAPADSVDQVLLSHGAPTSLWPPREGSMQLEELESKASGVEGRHGTRGQCTESLSGGTAAGGASDDVVERVKEALSRRISAVQVDSSPTSHVQVKKNPTAEVLRYAAQVSANSTNVTGTQGEVNSFVNDTLAKQEEKFSSKLNDISSRLDDHVGMVRESISKVAQFFDLYETTHLDLESRLVKGRDYQEKLQQLLRDATGQVSMVNEEMRTSTIGDQKLAAVSGRGMTGKLKMSQLASDGEGTKRARTRTSRIGNVKSTKSKSKRQPASGDRLQQFSKGTVKGSIGTKANSRGRVVHVITRSRRGSVEEDPGKSLDGGGKRGRSVDARIPSSSSAVQAGEFQSNETKVRARGSSPVLQTGPLAGTRLKQTRVRTSSVTGGGSTLQRTQQEALLSAKRQQLRKLYEELAEMQNDGD